MSNKPIYTSIETKRYLYYTIELEVRRLLSGLGSSLGRSNILTLTGPRKSGKTILLQQLVQSRQDGFYHDFRNGKMIDLMAVVENGYRLLCLDEVSLLAEDDARDLVSWLLTWSEKAVVILSGSCSAITEKISDDICGGKRYTLLPITYTEYRLWFGKANFSSNPYVYTESCTHGNNSALIKYLSNPKPIELESSTKVLDYLRGSFSDVVNSYMQYSEAYAKKAEISNEQFWLYMRYLGIQQDIYLDQHNEFRGIEKWYLSVARSLQLSQQESIEVKKRAFELTAIKKGEQDKTVQAFLEIMERSKLCYNHQWITDLNTFEKKDFYSFAYPWFTSLLYEDLLSTDRLKAESRKIIEKANQNKWVESLLRNACSHVFKNTYFFRDESVREVDILIVTEEGDFGVEVKNGPRANIHSSYLTERSRWPMKMFYTTSDDECGVSTANSQFIPNELLLRKLETYLIQGSLTGAELQKSYNFTDVIYNDNVIRLPAQVM